MVFQSSKQGKMVEEDFLKEVILERLADFTWKQRNWKMYFRRRGKA